MQSLVADDTTLYFVGAYKGPIFALPKTGGTPTFVSDPSSDGVYLFGVDATSLYWHSGTTLSSTPKIGGVSEQLVQREDGVDGVALDADNIYFGTFSHEIVKLSKATHATVTLASGLATHGGGHIVVQAKTLFFDQGQYPARIFSVPIDGGAVQDTCASGTGAIASIAVDDTTIYWGVIAEATGPIMSIPRVGQ